LGRDIGVSDSSGESPSAKAVVEGPKPQPPDADLPPALQRLIALEEQRIASANRRTDVVRLAIESNDASDKRQFDFRMAELDTKKTDISQRHSLAKIVIISAVGIGTVVAGLLLGMALFGAPDQSKIAIQILKVLGIGGAGYGLIGAVVRGISRMLKENLR
jgi:hypothetical protein